MRLNPLMIAMLVFLTLFVNTAFAQKMYGISHIEVLRRAYPDVTFALAYDTQKKDYLIKISRCEDDKRVVASLYWAGGRMLGSDKLSSADSYWPLFYFYPADTPDPASFTKGEIEHIREWTSAKNRKNQAGSSQDFFDVIYDASTRRKTEQHIKKINFLGYAVSVHEWIADALQQVEKDIRQLAMQETEVRNFMNSIARVEGYNWREISDRSSRSFHSFGLAVDILPKNWSQKNIYWAWRRGKDPQNWMLLPLDRRWMPPASVIRVFEKNGFVWGGKWMVWDNMHFEYHPELLAVSDK